MAELFLRVSEFWRRSREASAEGASKIWKFLLPILLPAAQLFRQNLPGANDPVVGGVVSLARNEEGERCVTRQKQLRGRLL